jgi:DNA-binding transcriptional LysR family regulator
MNHISQSAASQHIQEIERQMEVTLLDRSTRPVKLTPAGRLYYDFCRDVLRCKEALEVAMDRLKRQVEGTVRVASIYSVGLSEMSRLEREYTRCYPRAELRVQYLRPEKVYDAVIADGADIGLISYPQAGRGVKAIPWREETMVVAAAPSHPLAKQSVVRVRDLDGRDFVGFDEDLPVSRELKRLFRQHQVWINLVMHFDNIQIIKEAIALDSGVSILPERTLQEEIAQGRLVAIPLEAPGFVRPLGIIYGRRKKFNRATQAFLRLLQQEESAASQPGKFTESSL